MGHLTYQYADGATEKTLAGVSGKIGAEGNRVTIVRNNSEPPAEAEFGVDVADGGDDAAPGQE